MKRRLFILLPILAWLSPSIATAREATAEEYIDRPLAKLAILDKITARVRTITVAVGERAQNQRLQIDLARCAETPPEFTPEAVAYLSLSEKLQDDVGDQATTLFSGWIFASSPGLSAVEHPVYDVWLIDCLTPEEQ